MAAGSYCFGMYLPIICDVHERSDGEFFVVFCCFLFSFMVEVPAESYFTARGTEMFR